MKLKVFETFREGWRFCLEDPVMVSIAILVPTIPSSLADIYLDQQSAFRAASMLSLVSLLLQIIAIDRCLLRNDGIEVREGQPRSFYPRAFGQSLLCGLSIILGLILLVVPGIVLALRWAVALPILISRNSGVTESLRQSWKMIKGNELPMLGIFALAFVPLLLGVIIGVVVGGVSGIVISESMTSATIVLCWYLQIAVFLKLRASDDLPA